MGNITSTYFQAKVYWEPNQGPITFIINAETQIEVKKILQKSTEISSIISIEEINQIPLSDFL